PNLLEGDRAHRAAVHRGHQHVLLPERHGHPLRGDLHRRARYGAGGGGGPPHGRRGGYRPGRRHVRPYHRHRAGRARPVLACHARRDRTHPGVGARRRPGGGGGMSVPRVAIASKTALVTGAARGIGFAIASRLAAEGARVAVLDLDSAAAASAAEKIGGGALALIADVTKGAEVAAAVRRVVESWGRLDILVNNAGITGRSFPIWELSEEDW